MYCKNCGTKIENNVQFCPSCGNKVEINQVTQNNITQPQNKGVGKKAIIQWLKMVGISFLLYFLVLVIGIIINIYCVGNNLPASSPIRKLRTILSGIVIMENIIVMIFGLPLSFIISDMKQKK